MNRIRCGFHLRVLKHFAGSLPDPAVMNDAMSKVTKTVEEKIK
jgi:hypothetical protein